jgi:hypothetical protein
MFSEPEQISSTPVRGHENAAISQQNSRIAKHLINHSERVLDDLLHSSRRCVNVQMIQAHLQVLLERRSLQAIDPPQNYRDLPHDVQVFRRMAGTPPGDIFMDLRIRTPRHSIFEFPMTANCLPP